MKIKNSCVEICNIIKKFLNYEKMLFT